MRNGELRTGRKPGQTTLSTRRGGVRAFAREMVAPWDRVVSPGFRALVLLLACAGISAAQETFPGSDALDAVVSEAVQSGLIPGAVLIVGHDGKILHRKAYGSRALVPQREAMTLDTIFDLASLTKVVATTSAVMKVFEDGKLRLWDKVTDYLPEFQGGKSDITIRDLMTHFSGFKPDFDLDPPFSGYEAGIHRALIEKPQNPPGVRFVYSDTNFILMGEIVHRKTGKMLDELTQEEVFKPLGMTDTQFKPPASLRGRIAPTEIDAATGQPFRGVVHDPRARLMGGVAGHAGLFSTASDLSRFAEMMLGMGTRDGVRVFSPLTVRKFTSPETPQDQPVLRGLGWDIDSTYSSNRGELFPIGSYGHTGFTGTSIWTDPSTNSYVILLTNFVHPKAGKSLTGLRARVATIAAAAIGVDAPGVSVVGFNETMAGAGVRRMIAPNHRVLTGLDVLEQDKFAVLKGKKIGLITNHTGLDQSGRRNIDAMRDAGVQLTALFSPEHGITGKEDRKDVADAKDAATGLPLWSLHYNGRYRMTPEMLKDVDTLVFDIQDVGARFYTYSCTMLYALEESSKAGLPFYLLDRPNPVTGTHIEGPLLDDELQSFVGCYSMPIRHGLTLGELATMANGERRLSADLHIIKMKNWSRGDWFDSTGLSWIDPSPNMRSLNGATLYFGLAMIEYAKEYSVGRNTDAPFEQIGAEWIRGGELARFLNDRQVPGVRAYATRFTPGGPPLKDKPIEGVRFVIVNREQFSSVRLGLEVVYALGKLYPGKVDLEACRRLIGNRKVIESMKSGEDPRAIEQGIEGQLRTFEERRRAYLLY